jgi:hypothetical protein
VVADVRRVTDRDGKIRPLVLVDFPAAARRRLADLASALPQEPERDADLDLSRLSLATRELANRQDQCAVLVPISWSTLTVANCRRSLDKCLAAIDAATCSRLMLAVSGAPPRPSGQRWSDVTGPLRRQIKEVGLTLTLGDADHAATQEVMVNDWPLSLLVIDGTEGTPMAPSEYFALIAAARRRNIQVLVRPAAEENISDWRELGATMFVGSA